MSGPESSVAQLPDALVPAFEELREIVRLDGADLVVRDVTGSSIELDLDVSGAECLECVMPRDVLEEILTARLGELDAGIDRVIINDPR